MKHPLIPSILAASTAIFLCQCKGGGPGGTSTETPTGGGGASAGAAGGTPITMEFPPENFEGTPKPANIPNLIPIPNEPRKLLVPAEATLLSKGKKVTGSDNTPIIGTLELITDGDKQAGSGYFVELLDGVQWVQIDLEKTADISAVCVWHYHLERRAYNDVIIQVSNDPAFKTGVTTLYNNDYDESAKMGRGKDNPYVESRFGLICDGMGTTGRYVRLYSNGNTSTEMNHYTEVEVYGIAKQAPRHSPRPPDDPPTGGGAAAGAAGDTHLTMEFPPENFYGTPTPMSVPNLVQIPTEPRKLLVPAGTTLLSKGKKVTSSDDFPFIGTLELITDGDKQAGEDYYVELLDGVQWVQIDLEKTADISAVCVWHFHSQRRAYNDVIIQISDDPEFKTGVTTIYNNDYDESAKMGRGTDNPYVESRFGLICDGMGSKGRYVRLYSNGNTTNEMNNYTEVEVYGIAK